VSFKFCTRLLNLRVSVLGVAVQGSMDPHDVSILNARFQLSVVRSCARLTYAHAQQLISGQQPSDMSLHCGVTTKEVRVFFASCSCCAMTRTIQEACTHDVVSSNGVWLCSQRCKEMWPRCSTVPRFSTVIAERGYQVAMRLECSFRTL